MYTEIKRKRKLKIKQLAVLLVVVALLVAAWLFWSGRERPSQDAQLEKVGEVEVHQMLVEPGTPGRPGTPREVRYIVIHETGNRASGANAANHGAFLTSGSSGTTSWHYTVDEKEIYHHIPDNEVAWHAGDGVDGDGNLHGIGVELCVNKDGNFEKTMKNAARLTAALLEAYDLELEDVKQHHDFSGKNCPQTIREQDRWEEFIKMVKKAR